MADRRHVWVGLVLLGATGILVGGALATPVAAVRLGYLLAAPVFVVLTGLALLRRIPLDVAIGTGLVIGTVLFLVRLASLPAVRPEQLTEVAFTTFRGITLLSGTAFIALGPSRGLVLSGLIWAGGVGVLVAGPMSVRAHDDFASTGLGVALLSAVVVLMFRLLSSSVEQATMRAQQAQVDAAQAQVRAAQAQLAAAQVQDIAELAFRDELTGLPNRRQMMVSLRAAVVRAVEGGGPDSLVMFDLDRFKEVNDTLGHQVGDEVLRRTAVVVGELLRSGDLLCRWGGEEFLVLLADTDADEALRIAQRCRQALASMPHHPQVTASFGVTAIHSTDTLTDALRRVDLALYDAKQAGRNRVVLRRPGQQPAPDPVSA